MEFIRFDNIPINQFMCACGHMGPDHFHSVIEDDGTINNAHGCIVCAANEDVTKRCPRFTFPDISSD